MSSKKKADAVAPGEPVPFTDVIEEIAEAVKTLTAAGMGGQTAGDLAFKVWCATSGTVPPVVEKQSYPE